ncbi:MAG TPA: HD domain-containing protein [Patescibacteria group bacterium]
MDCSKKIKKIRAIVKKACYSQNNKFTETVWDYHILPVVKHSLALGKKLKANLCVLEIAALLHDHAGITNAKLYPEHHIHGARMAKEILEKFKFPKEKIEAIQNCIVSHRGSVRLKQETLEARILASADAMSHITEPVDMFYLAYGVHKNKTKEGAKWLKKKLERSWKKIMPEGKKMIKKEYKILTKMLSKAL